MEDSRRLLATHRSPVRPCTGRCQKKDSISRRLERTALFFRYEEDFKWIIVLLAMAAAVAAQGKRGNFCFARKGLPRQRWVRLIAPISSELLVVQRDQRIRSRGFAGWKHACC